MKTIFKKGLAVIMVVVMLCSVMTVAGFSSFATDGSEGEIIETTSSESIASEAESSSAAESVVPDESSSSSETESQEESSSASETESVEGGNEETESSESDTPSETNSSENQEESSEATEATEPVKETNFKGVDVTFKSAQGLFDDVVKTYRQGEVFEFAINWSSKDKITGYDIYTLFDCEGLEVLYQTINSKAKGTGNIDKDVQISDNMVTINYSKYNGVVWSEKDYIVKYKVKVLADEGSQQTMTIDLRDVTFVAPSNGDYENPKWDYSGEFDFDYINTGEIVEEYKDRIAASVDVSEPQAPYKKYTLVGNINGKDVGFGVDSATIVPEYNFVKGKVTVRFDSNTGKVSYIVGEDAYNNTESSDTTAPTSNVYRVVGSAGLCTSEWDPADEHNDMTYVGDGVYTKVFKDVNPGEYEFKVYENYDKNNTENVIYGNDGVNSDNVVVKIGNEATVKVACTKNSYVFVKTTNVEPTEWYMFDAFTTENTGTLHKNQSVSKEKMEVPAGYVTFTLVENEDGSLNLSYVVDDSVIPTEPYIPNEYTIVGCINGEDVGFDNDAQAVVPAYNFVDGSVTIIFDSDSYVFVKTTDNEHWYMSEGYCDQNSCVMYDTTVNQLKNANKMYVPAGKAKFTLVENEDGTITLSYEMDGEYTPELIDKEYAVVGFINGKNLGCDEDYENVYEEYTFVRGSVDVEFTEDSYIFVKTTDNENWYMFQQYINDDTTGTLYNTVTGTKEKMFIPAGKYTLVLSETGKDRLRLTYVPYEEPTEPTEEPVETKPTVKPTEPKKPAFKVTSKTLKAGQKYTLKVVNAGGKKAKSWKSSNTKVATVSSSGAVTALGKGKTVISATVAGKKIKCTIKVSSSPKVYNGKKAVKNNRVIKVKKGKTLKLTIKGKASAVKNSYKNYNKKIAKVISKKTAKTVKIKAYKKGTAKITITVNKKYKTTIKVKVV